MRPQKLIRIVASIFLAIIGISLISSSVYTVPEGSVAIEQRFGKVTDQTDVGLQFKIPLIERAEIIDIRQRKNVEKLSAATANQLPITAEVSVNWTVNKAMARELFVKYGSLTNFENVILDPRMRQAAKAAISKFPADQLIRDRNEVTAKILEYITIAMEGFPIVINSPQLEDAILPSKYLKAIEAKESAREQAEMEKHNLAKQKLIAQREVQSAEATRDSNIALADGNAYRIKKEAIAEAEAIALVNAELAKSSTYVDLVRAKSWNGALPQTVLGPNTGVFATLGK